MSVSEDYTVFYSVFCVGDNDNALRREAEGPIDLLDVNRPTDTEGVRSDERS